MLRAVGFIAAGVVVGFVLGGVPARRDKQALTEENRALRDQLRSHSGPNILSLLLGQGLGEDDAPLDDAQRGAAVVAAAAENARPPEGGNSSPEPERVAGEVTVIGGRDETGRERAVAPTTPDARPLAPWQTPEAQERRQRRREALRGLTRDGFRQFAAAQAARAAASRAALVASARLNDQQVAALDSTIENTNRKLEGYGEEVLTNVAAGKEPEPAEALSLTRDVADILHEGQTEVDRIVSEAGGEVPRDATQIWNLVSPEGLQETADRVLPEKTPEGTPPLVPGTLFPTRQSSDAGSGSGPSP